MPFYVGDYLADTGHLSTVEHGAYMLLIMHYWQHEGLPTEGAKLARIARLGQADWDAIRDTIADLFGDNWTHKRIDAELARASETVAKRSAAGKANAAARYANRKPMASQSELPRERASPSPPQPEKVAAQPSASAAISEKPPEAPAIPIVLWRGERTREWFDQVEAECREAAGLSESPDPMLADVSPIVMLIDKGFDFARDILPKLRAAKAANKRGRTWAYYVAAIVEGKAANGRISPKTNPGKEPPPVWITDEDPLWPFVAENWRKAKGKPPPILAGSHGNVGRGWHFPAEMIPAQAPPVIQR